MVIESDFHTENPEILGATAKKKKVYVQGRPGAQELFTPNSE